MAEGARLESVYAGDRIEGSNPSPSASNPQKHWDFWVFVNSTHISTHIPNIPSRQTQKSLKPRVSLSCPDIPDNCRHRLPALNQARFHRPRGRLTIR